MGLLLKIITVVGLFVIFFSLSCNVISFLFGLYSFLLALQSQLTEPALAVLISRVPGYTNINTTFGSAEGEADSYFAYIVKTDEPKVVLEVCSFFVGLFFISE